MRYRTTRQTLFNIITDRQQTVYIFGANHGTLEVAGRQIHDEGARTMNDVCHLDPSDLQEEMKRIFGSACRVVRIDRMSGGAQKAVYKIECADGFACVLYVWDLGANYFREDLQQEDPEGWSYGSERFETNHRELTRLDIRIPALYSLNREKVRYPFDYAFVEYIDGPKAETFLTGDDAQAKDLVMQTIGDMVTSMHMNERSIWGKPGGSQTPGRPCHQVQLENAQKQLAYAAEHLDSFRANRDRLSETLLQLESRIVPRSRYGFIHGELGPDHVLFNERLEPYLIDIEGAEYFDIEHEHSFLEFRFGKNYRYFANEALDPDRMRFYRFHHYLSLTAGGLKLLHRGFPDAAFARGLTEAHSRNALRMMEEWT
jgi:hypothetical protein